MVLGISFPSMTFLAFSLWVEKLTFIEMIESMKGKEKGLELKGHRKRKRKELQKSTCPNLS